MKTIIWLIVIIVIVVIGMSVIPGKEPAPNPAGGISQTIDETDTSTTTKRMTVNASSFKFEPATFTVNKGDTVIINFVNTEGFHDFVIDEFNAKTKQLQANQTEEISFVADKAGSFEYYCSVGDHRQKGMVGTLIVK